MSKEAWNSRYGTEEYIYGKKPNEFFKAELDKLKPGKIYLPGEGEGRNAVYAARNHWEVWATDQSEEGRSKAMKLAEETGVSFRYDVGDITTLEIPNGTFDVIALIYIHMAPEQRQLFHRRLVKALKPGGLIILEAFTKEQVNFDSGGPKDPDLLYSSSILAEDFAQLKVLMNSEMRVIHDEGSFHRGEGAIVRLIARVG